MQDGRLTRLWQQCLLTAELRVWGSKLLDGRAHAQPCSPCTPHQPARHSDAAGAPHPTIHCTCSPVSMRNNGAGEAPLLHLIQLRVIQVPGPGTPKIHPGRAPDMVWGRGLHCDARDCAVDQLGQLAALPPRAEGRDDGPRSAPVQQLYCEGP